MASSVTIKDVAHHAGVSVATVSNVLNERNTVNRDIVRRVREAVETLGYKRHQAGWLLKTKKSMQVNIILPSITDPHFCAVFSGAERVLHKNGYNAALHVTSEIRSKENHFLEMSLQQRVAGVILVTCQPDKMGKADELVAAETRVVCLEREPTLGGFSFLEHDLHRLIHDATQALLKQGYRRLVLLTGPREYTSEARAAAGFLDALGPDVTRSGISGSVLETNCDTETAFHALIRHIGRGESPDLILSTSSVIHQGARKAVDMMRSRLNGPIRFITLAEESWSDIASDDRLTIRRSGIQLGAAAAEALLDSLRNPLAHEGHYRRLESPSPFITRPPSLSQYRGQELRVLMLSGTSMQSVADLISDFEDKHATRVRIDSLEDNELHEALSDPRRRAAYDVLQIDQPWMSDLASSGCLIRLNDRLEARPAMVQGLVPGVMDAYCRFDDGYYGLPFRFDVQLLFYRKDLFDDPTQRLAFRDLTGGDLHPPETWREFNVIARFFTKKYNPASPTAYGISLGAYPPNGALSEFLTRLWGTGGRIRDENGRIALDSREAEEALENYIESISYAAPGWQDKRRSGQVEDFSRGDVAMMALFCAPVAPLADRSRSAVVGKIGYASVPGGAPVMGGWSMGITRECRQVDLAFDWIAWTACSELAVPLTIMGGLTPALTLYNSLELLSIYPWLSKAAENFALSHPRDISLKSTDGKLNAYQFEQIVGRFIHDALKSEKSPKQALDEAASELRRILTQRDFGP